MPPEDQDRLAHMLAASEDVMRFLAGRSREDLDQDKMLQYAVVRAIEIIGEAASKVSPTTRSVHNQIPWTAIVGMRNRLIHAYFSIDNDVLWESAQHEIPLLISQLDRLEDDAGGP